MGLYIGSQKFSLNINNSRYRFDFYTQSPIIDEILLLDSEGTILRDSNGLFLTVDTIINGTILMSSDNYILRDSNRLYLTVKESE